VIARHVTPQFLRFLVTGTLNTAASYGVYFLLLQVMPYLAAYTVAYVFGIALSYVLMTRFVFRAPAKLATAVRFPLVYVAQYVLGSAIVYALVEHARVPAWLAAAVAMVVVVPTTFVMARLVFRR